METVKSILILFRGTYGERFEINQGTEKIWRSLVSEYPDSELQEAARELCKKLKFPPTPADLINEVKEARVKSQPLLEKTAAELWEKAKRKLLINKDKYRQFLLSEAVPSWIKRAFEGAGGIALCTMENVDRNYPRFEKIFNFEQSKFLEAVERSPKGASLKQLEYSREMKISNYKLPEVSDMGEVRKLVDMVSKETDPSLIAKAERYMLDIDSKFVRGEDGKLYPNQSNQREVS